MPAPTIVVDGTVGPGPGGFEPVRVFRSDPSPPPFIPGIAPVAPANGAPDLVTQARSRVITQYRNAVKLLATIDALSYLTQDLANAVAQMPVFDDLDQAGGVNLEATAELVGQGRVLSGHTIASDDFLRALTRLRIIRNHSIGSAPEIIAGVVALLGNDGTPIVYSSRGAMFASVQFTRQPTNLEIAAIQSDLLPRPMGVTLIVSWYLPARHFAWSGDPAATGFGEATDPTKGGGFAEAV